MSFSRRGLTKSLNQQKKIANEVHQQVRQLHLGKPNDKPRNPSDLTSTTTKPAQNHNKDDKIPEPKSFAEAQSSPYRKQWKAAMDDEFKALIKNNVWVLTDLPKGRKALRSKWV